MKLMLALGTAIAASLMTVGVASATTTDACFDRGRGHNSCVALTSEKKVEYAVVKTAKWTSGIWSVRCVKGNVVYRDYARIGRDRTKVIRIAAALNRPDCVLRLGAQAFNGHEARGRVTLVGGLGS